ncbi:MAG: tetratricopeptide repeat protein [Planctomycetes bacterium]|nr:tetratricopeptide repeat protein [Planctomycetota bacterium]
MKFLVILEVGEEHHHHSQLARVVLLGWVLYRTGDYKEAVRQLERAVQLRPQDPTINDHLGDVLRPSVGLGQIPPIRGRRVEPIAHVKEREQKHRFEGFQDQPGAGSDHGTRVRLQGRQRDHLPGK